MTCGGSGEATARPMQAQADIRRRAADDLSDLRAIEVVPDSEEQDLAVAVWK